MTAGRLHRARRVHRDIGAGMAVGIAAALFALPALPARADDGREENARLRLVYEAPRDCARASEFRDRVLSLVRTAPGSWKSAVEVRVGITRGERGYVGRLGIMQHDEQHDGDHRTSERELRAATCAPVVAALAVSAALAIDDALEASAAPAPTAPAPTAPQAADERPTSSAPIWDGSATPAMKARRREQRGQAVLPTPRPLELRLGGASALRWGVAPDPLWMQSASLSVGHRATLWPPTLRGELGYGASPIARTPHGAFRTRLFEAAVSACTPSGDAWLAHLGVCAGVSGGVLASTSFEVIRPADRVRPWFTAFIAPRVSLPLTAGLAIVAEGRVAFPFVRETLTFYPGIEVYEAPATVFQGALGLEVSLPTPRRNGQAP
ncbi:hypothetical protein [Labilithrix luteola]|nr:hypothetical protein [Labilithrix luteola]